MEAAARGELRRVTGLRHQVDAGQVLADRLARRLSEQLRMRGPIKDPVGWLLAVGLPQQQECGDALCDDRTLIGSGEDCPQCEDRLAHRRAQRSAVAARVDAAMPGASEAERRAATAAQLHQDVTAQGWIREHRWVQIREQQAAAKAHRAEAAAAQTEDQVPAAPVAPVVLPAPRPAALAPAPEVADVDDDQELVLDGGASSMPAPREPEGPPRSSCGDCGCRIFLTGRALEDGLCKLCREEAEDLVAVGVAQEQQAVTCQGSDGFLVAVRRCRAGRSAHATVLRNWP